METMRDSFIMPLPRVLLTVIVLKFGDQAPGTEYCFDVCVCVRARERVCVCPAAMSDRVSEREIPYPAYRSV